MNIAFSYITRKVPRELQGYWDIPDRSFKRIIKKRKNTMKIEYFSLCFWTDACRFSRENRHT